MDTTWRTFMWQQFGAAIEMLERAIEACPVNVWADRTQRPEYWYVVYHTLFFLDLYLSDSIQEFKPPAPYTLSELDPAGVFPDRIYTKDELHAYLDYCRRKCRERIDATTREGADQLCSYRNFQMTRAEALVYNLRHVQHHVGQLYLMLRQRIDSTPGWVGAVD